MSGEQLHQLGADGARRAKLWLEATTRANVHWRNPDPLAVPKLTFDWGAGGSFSYDLGGTLSGGEVDGQEFLAECKMYANANDQSAQYEAYLAKCYCAFLARPDRCDNFMWITWAAFATTTWSDLLSASRVSSSVLKHSERCFDLSGGVLPNTLIDPTVCDQVAKRLWLIVLSERQEKHLVLSPEHQALIRGDVAERAARS